jgi:hypothetical protein
VQRNFGLSSTIRKIKFDYERGVRGNFSFDFLVKNSCNNDDGKELSFFSVKIVWLRAGEGGESRHISFAFCRSLKFLPPKRKNFKIAKRKKSRNPEGDKSHKEFHSKSFSTFNPTSKENKKETSGTKEKHLSSLDLSSEEEVEVVKIFTSSHHLHEGKLCRIPFEHSL